MTEKQARSKPLAVNESTTERPLKIKNSVMTEKQARSKPLAVNESTTDAYDTTVLPIRPENGEPDATTSELPVRPRTANRTPRISALPQRTIQERRTGRREFPEKPPPPFTP